MDICSHGVLVVLDLLVCNIIYLLISNWMKFVGEKIKNVLVMVEYVSQTLNLWQPCCMVNGNPVISSHPPIHTECEWVAVI